MTPLEWVTASEVRSEVHDKIYDLLVEVETAGWRIRRQGHKFKLYCPCAGRDGSMLRVDGTPRNPEQQAKRLRRELSHCPDRHSLDH